MSFQNIALKRKIDGAEVVLLPLTTTDRVYTNEGLTKTLTSVLNEKMNWTDLGTLNGPAKLDGDGKILSSQIPQWMVISGPYNAAAVSTETYNLSAFIALLNADLSAGQNANSRRGWYIVITRLLGTTINYANGTPTNHNYVIDGGDDGTPASNGMTLDVTDTIMFTGMTYSNPTYTYSFAVINNKMKEATNTRLGIMASSNATNLMPFNASLNPGGIEVSHAKAITEYTLANITFGGDVHGIIEATQNKLVKAGHTHGQYSLTTHDHAGTYLTSLVLAANGTRGGLQIGYTSTETQRALELSSERGFVTLPRQIPAVTLNNAGSTAPSFYAPTTSGTAGSASVTRQFLVSMGAGVAPVWVDQPRILYGTSTGALFGDIIIATS